MGFKEKQKTLEQMSEVGLRDVKLGTENVYVETILTLE